tara:strand:- start:594 stop:998 length:405 start_codon:yes stop_codon:yes gene_type:complete
MIETEDKSSLKPGSNRNFGLVFSIVFLLIGLFPVINSGPIRIWSIVLASIFFIISFLNPGLFKHLNFIWFKFGLLLSSIASPIVLLSLYLFAIIPTSLLLKLFVKDPLKLKLHKNEKSYWIKRDKPLQSMKRQF